MRTTPAAAVIALALAATGCAQAEPVLEAVAPHYFYGFASSAREGALCVADQRDGEPDRERCFQLADDVQFRPQQFAQEIRRGSLVKIRYERHDDEDVALEIIQGA